LHTTTSHYGKGRSLGGGGVTFTINRGSLSGESVITAASSSTKDFDHDARALMVKLRANL
jgi:hypothetical protein